LNDFERAMDSLSDCFPFLFVRAQNNIPTSKKEEKDQHHVNRPSLPAETVSIGASGNPRSSAAKSLTGCSAQQRPPGASNFERAMDSFSCCEKSFGTASALAHHTRQVHGENKKKRNKTHAPKKYPHFHRAPFELEGHWVKSEAFHGDKSFGHFVCRHCSKKWQSAHAFKMYEQGCKKCDTMSLPCCLWANSECDRRDSGESDYENREKRAPHDQSRCEACLDGLCLAALRVY
jgi:hypothetical protein